ncbi:hypothetical protein [Nitrospira sp. Kam-Ns4a]
MRGTPQMRWLLLVIVLAAGESQMTGCWATNSVRVPERDRPRLAVLGFDLDVDITSLSAIRSVEEALPPEREALLVAQAVREIREEARHLLYSGLKSGEQFRLVSLEETDAVRHALGIERDASLTTAQVRKLREYLDADLVVRGAVLDYGKVRWQWAAAGMLGDMLWETVVIGVATAWNPAIILGNVGFELLTSTPVWFGGAYLFGVACRPVRVEAEAIETQEGTRVWSKMAVATCAWGRLKALPASERTKKEAQLRLNLSTAMRSLAESLDGAGLTREALWEMRLPEPPPAAF